MDQKLAQLVRSIRAFLLIRTAVRYGAFAAVVMVASSLVAAIVAPGLPRLPWLSLLAVGLLVGLIRELFQLPPAHDIALYIDRKLGAESSIVTAIELDDDGRRRLSETVSMATSKLSGAHMRDVRPKFSSRALWLYPIAIPCFALVLLYPSIAPTDPSVPGTEEVRIDDAEALTQLEHLAEEEVTDTERQERLEELAEQASKLRQLLSDGAEQREALDQVAELSETVEREIGRESAAERRARDRAIEALDDEAEMSSALAERDLEALDQAVERAAARREAADRARAQQALRGASEAAAGEGDSALSHLLAASERRLRQRSEQARLARALLEGMPELEGGRLSRALERLERDGDGSQLDEALVDAMREAWSQLTPDERQRLADAIRDAPVDPGDGHAQADAGRPLTADEIESRLREALANLDDLRIQLGSGQCAMPMPSAGVGRSSGSSRGGQSGSASSGSGGHQDTPGETQPLDESNDLVVRVRPVQGEGVPSFSTVEWVDPRGSVDQERGDALPAPGAPVEGSPGAIERAPIPEDYEEHLRRYFGDSPQRR